MITQPHQVSNHLPLAINPTQPGERHGRWGRKAGPVEVRRVRDDYGEEKILITNPDTFISDDDVRIYACDDVFGWGLRLASLLQVKDMPTVWARLRDAQEAIKPAPKPEVRDECQALVVEPSEVETEALEAMIRHYRTALAKAIRTIQDLMRDPAGQNWLAIENWVKGAKFRTRKVEAKYRDAQSGDMEDDEDGEEVA